MNFRLRPFDSSFVHARARVSLPRDGIVRNIEKYWNRSLSITHLFIKREKIKIHDNSRNTLPDEPEKSYRYIINVVNITSRIIKAPIKRLS